MTAITSDRRAVTGTSALHGHQLEGDMARAAAAGSPCSSVAVAQAEGIVTFVLILVFISATADSHVPRGVAAMLTGSALAVAIFISGPWPPRN